VAVAFGFIGCVIVLLLVRASTHRKQRRDSALVQLARHVSGTASRNGVEGAIDGVRVSLSYETRSSGSSSEAWTYVDAALPRGYPLTLRLRRHGWFDAGTIARGEMVDVIVGDPVFDEAFRVEGAPAEVVRRILQADARALLSAHDPVELDTQPDGTVRLAIRRWVEDVPAAGALLTRVARLATSIRGATLALDEAVPPTEAGSPYRAMTDDRSVGAVIAYAFANGW
jgi:hypothetical protein